MAPAARHARPSGEKRLANITAILENSDPSNTTATATGNGTGMLDLPPEVFENVARRVNSEDLVALRLVNRDIQAKVLRTFSEVHFHTTAFLLYSKKSLEAFISIAKNESFGRAMRKVMICLDQIHETRSDPLPRPGPRRSPSNETQAQRQARERRESEYERCIEVQRRFQRSEEPRRLLTAGFSQLRKLKHTMALEVTSSESLSRRSAARTECIGHESLQSLTGEHVRLIPDFDRQIAMLVDSVERSEIQVDDFSVANAIDFWNISTLTSNDRLSYAAKFFSGLRHLDLSFWSRQKLTPTEVCRVRRLFGNADGLETFSMQFRYSPDSLFHELLLMTFKKLKKFRVATYAKIRITDIVDFINSHKETLSSVSFEDATIASPSAVDALASVGWRSQYVYAYDEAIETIVKDETGFEGVSFRHCRATKW